MARLRSDKSKNKPLDKPVEKKEKLRAGQSDRGQTSGEPSERVTSGLQPAAQPDERPRQQEIQEPSADARESENFSEQPLLTTNGHQSIEDDSTTQRRIAERAFILFQESGCEHGNDWSHWFEAERQIKERRV